MTTTTLPSAFPSARRRVAGAALVWLAFAAGCALTGALARLPRPATPLFIWGPVIAAAVAYRSSPALRGVLAGISLRAIVLFHVVRALIGAAFLVQDARGVLPSAFAQPAGWGDIAVGLLAILAALVVPAAGRALTGTRRAALLAWNTFGLIDILMAFVAAQRLIFFVGDPRMLAALGNWPFSLIPLVVVPAVIATHLLLFARLRAR
jgi:hypothetical protein